MSTPASAVAGMTDNSNFMPSSFMNPNAPIGGTSGGSGNGAGANVLSMNLGGVNVNYDMGPSTGEASNAAYNFLDNSFNADSALLGNTIVGSQNFLSGMTAPVLSMATTQQNFNTQVLPSMFGTLSAQNYSLGSQAVSAEASVAEASIQSSAASAQNASQGGGGGGCFITTAVCESRNEPDDCPTLTKLRAFRDGYMQTNEHLRAVVATYYRSAPRIVDRIKQQSNAAKYFDSIYERFIVPAVEAIDRGDELDAFTIYTQMFFEVQQEVFNGTAAVL
jgi:hypothetical protein